jgi:plastocyanin
MNKKIIAAIVITILVIAGVIWWLMSSIPPNTSTPTPPNSNSNQTTSEAAPDAVAAETITYTNDGFSPATVTAKVGDTIRIVNQSGDPLEFSSNNHPTHRENPELNMPTIQAGDDGMLKVTKVGEWGYHNHLNTQHVGKLTVTE